MQISAIGFKKANSNIRFKGNSQEAVELINAAKKEILKVVENKFYLGNPPELTKLQKETKLYSALMSLDKALMKLLNKEA